MTMSLFTIIFMRLEIEWRAITLAVAGSIPGIIFGFHYVSSLEYFLTTMLFFQVDPFLTAPQKKMLFVSIWSSFAIALWILNRERKRRTVPNIQQFCKWKAVVLFVTGIVGGKCFEYFFDKIEYAFQAFLHHLPAPAQTFAFLRSSLCCFRLVRKLQRRPQLFQWVRV